MSDPSGPRDFLTTQWSLVLAARREASSRTLARQALEKLCRAYWYPLYAFARYRGHSAEDAQDLTQSFFARILETDGIAGADPARGRFRSYLLGAMKHFLANEWRRARARKRGGGITFITLDASGADTRHALDPPATEDPDLGFDRQWAQAIVARALERLRAEFLAAGKSDQFELLQGSLGGEERPRSESAARLGLSEGALKVAVHRLRRRYRELLRDEIAQTVAEEQDVDDELRHLSKVLRGG